ncbi:MAG: hypothetical protein ACYC5O_07125 [Anaerolineae bacterium]
MGSRRARALVAVALLVLVGELAIPAAVTASDPPVRTRAADPALAPHAVEPVLWLPFSSRCYPCITVTGVPAYGDSGDATGRVAPCIDLTSHKVAVYINVGGGYWNKPYWAAPLTDIGADGSWSADITTGGSDSMATLVVAFLVPADYTPPHLAGEYSLPAELYAEAIGVAVVYRPDPEAAP